MYSGLLPKGFTEDDLSPDEEENVGEEEEERDEKLRPKEENAASSVEAVQAVSVSGWDANNEAQCSLPGISQDMWQKFKALQRKKEEAEIIEVSRKRKRRRRKKGDKREEHWDDLKQYFGANDRFQPPRSGLEKSIERAIAEGDVAKAEEMSDSLATRELAVKIAQAADCRDFAKRKQEEEALKAAQKRKKEIAWGYAISLCPKKITLKTSQN
uniref:Family with sequence similarity 204 member A n=1 Tax=Neogobius melanostomus TaxID=47308 RepID=A0A8C6UWF1_9GOBI